MLVAEFRFVAQYDTSSLTDKIWGNPEELGEKVLLDYKRLSFPTHGYISWSSNGSRRNAFQVFKVIRMFFRNFGRNSAFAR